MVNEFERKRKKVRLEIRDIIGSTDFMTMNTISKK